MDILTTLESSNKTLTINDDLSKKKVKCILFYPCFPSLPLSHSLPLSLTLTLTLLSLTLYFGPPAHFTSEWSEQSVQGLQLDTELEGSKGWRERTREREREREREDEEQLLQCMRLQHRPPAQLK